MVTLHKFFAALTLTLFLLAGPAFATDTKEVTVNKDNLKQLIETLESETARTEFINNLKTLSETESKKTVEEEKVVPVTQSLGLQATTQRILDGYRDFLAKNDLNGTVIGRVGLSIVALLLALAMGWLVRRVTISLKRRLENLRQHLGVRHKRYRLYTLGLRYIGYAIIFALYVYSITLIWDITAFAFLRTEAATSILSGALGIFLVVVVGILFWESLSGALDYGLKRATDRKAGRMRTLLPIVKSVLFMMFTVLFTLMLLSELGINILPLLAGAGIVGVAIGFGAQKMVQDFIGGFSIILEDLFHVGDVVNIAGVSGVVEDITLRKVQLRDVNGAVFTIPYSEITVIRNLTKDFSYYLLDMPISFGEDTDRVVEVIRAVGEEMRREEAYAHQILEPVDIMGIERFEQNAFVIRMRLKTLPAMQWSTGREFNRRLKRAFDAHGIETPTPQQAVVYRDEKAAPPKRRMADPTD